MSIKPKSERKYASFFEGGTKEQKEKFVSSEWLNTYGKENGYNEATLSTVNDQWPDCQVEEIISGKLCGIEVTELVDSECIRLNEMGKNVYRAWDKNDLIKAIEERLNTKNNKSHGGKYKKLIVLIHTDEFEIRYDEYSSFIEQHRFSKMENIDEAYLLYSYDPIYKKYPVSVINF
jgi:hypothetical protein